MWKLGKFVSVNPATEEVLGEYEYASFDEAERECLKLKLESEWALLDVSERARAIRAVGQELLKEKRSHAELMTLEMGKPIKQALAEVEKCARECDYFAANAEKFMQPEEIKTEFKQSFVELAPLGVVLGIMPWNFPYWQLFRFAVPAMLAGNRIVIKHAPNTPQCSLAIEKVFCSLMPSNSFKNVFLNVEDTGKLIEGPAVDAVSITGSTRAGASVAERAGKAIKKSVLELGGSDAFIVLDDAHVPSCCAAAKTSRFVNGGQSCIAAKRFIVVKEAADEFTRLFVEQVKSLRVGDPFSESTDVGPIARSDLRDGLHEIVARSLERGADAVVGGRKREGKGFFYEPTVLAGVTPEMPVAQEEAFGPVAPVIVARDEKHAVEIANHSEYGLAASVWTRDEERAIALARELEVGFVSVNEVVKSDPRLPFGGVKKSGYGRELSHYALREFANVKTVVVK